MNSPYKKILFVLSLLLIMFIPFWTLFVGPRLLQLPVNFSYSADLISFDNFYDQTTHSFVGQSASNSSFQYSVTSVESGILNIKNSFDVRTLTGEKIFHVDRLYGIDPITRQHVQGFGDHDRIGYLFAPAELTAGSAFTYWHANYDEPTTMQYQGEEELFGLPTYHYQATFHPDQTKELDDLPNVGETLGVNLDVILDLWVEPASGFLVKYTDQAEAYYYDLGSQQRLYPWNFFLNTYTDDSVLKQVRLAQQDRYLAWFIGRVIPSVLFFLILLCIFPTLFGQSVAFDRFIRRCAPLAISLVGLTISLAAWFFVTGIIERQALLAFERDVSSATQRILDRLEIYQNGLRGVSGLFTASGEVTREEFKAYFAGVDFEKDYPGILGIGYAPVVRASEKNKYELAAKADGFPEYAIFPTGEREVYVPMLYFEPFDERQNGILGNDLTSDPARQLALNQARDTDASTATGKIILAEASEQSSTIGFLLVAPYYGQTEPYSLIDRRQAIQGYMTVTFHMTDLIEGIFQQTPPTVAFNIYDEAIGQNNNGILFKNPDVDVLQPTQLRTSVRHIFIYGHPWEIIFAQLPTARYRSTFERAMPWIVLGAGILITSLATTLIYSANRGHLTLKQPRKK